MKKVFELSLAIAMTAATAPTLAQAAAQAGHSATPSRTAAASLTLHIDSQPMEAALQEFGRQSHLQVAYPADTVSESLLAPSLSGTFQSAAAALEKLLNGSGLAYRFVNFQTVAIRPAQRQTPSKASRKSLSYSTGPDATPGALSVRGLHFAQANESSAATASSDVATSTGAGEPRLEQIVVTAQRREEVINRVPISISALSQQTMDDLHIQNISDLATVVPGLVLTPPVATVQDFGDVGIRGVFSSANGGFVGNAPTTQLYIDETPIAIRQLGAAASRSPWPNIFDLDRVEVLRGPQGTLFGASAMGGAIRFITPQPSLQSSSGFAKAELGYTQGGDLSYEVGGAYGGVIVPGRLGFRVSAWYQSLGGFIDQENPFTGQILDRHANTADSYVIRPAVTWAPSDSIMVTPSIYLQHSHDNNPSGYWVTGLAAPQSDGHVWGGFAEPMTDDLEVASFSIKYNAANWSLVSDTSYLYRKSEAFEDITHSLEDIFSGTPFIPALDSFAAFDDNFSYTQAWQQEFRISSQNPASRVSWVAGAFYRRAVQRLQQLQSPDLSPITEYVFNKTSQEASGVPDYFYNGEALNFYDDYRATDTSEALFGDITLSLLSRLKFDIGLRYEHLTVTNQTQVNAGPILFTGVEYSSVTLPDVSEHPITPRASLTYQITDDDMVYASAGKGYRAGGANLVNINTNPQCQNSLQALGLTAAPESFNSDHLWSYELGTKDLLFDHRLSIDGSVFYIKWSDIQSGIALPSCSNAFTANRGEAISQGFDLQLAAMMTRELKIGAQVGYTNAYHPQAAYGPPPSGPGPAGSVTSALINAAGDKLSNSIPWTVATNVEYTRNISSLWPDSRSYLRIDYRWLSGVVSGNPNVGGYDLETSPYLNPSYGILNLRLGVMHAGWDLSLYVNNVTDSDPRLGYSHDFYSSPLFYASTIRPRTAGITSWYRF